ncbi:MAG: hypothetical protein U0W24_06005 [Bacteroidales bacterium]
MADTFNLSMVWSLGSFLFQIIVFGACAYYVSQKQTTDSILLALGSFIHLFTSLFYTVGIPVLTRMGSNIYGNTMLFNIVGFFSFLGTIAFSLGFVLLIIEKLKIDKSGG